jgi:hypothetical protein
MRTWPGSAGENSETARLSVLKMRKLMNEKNQMADMKAARAREVCISKASNVASSRVPENPAHSTLAMNLCPRMKHVLRYNDRSVYPRA